MALSIGNKTGNLSTPAAITQTFSHTQNVGSDGHLFILIAMSNATTISGVTYNGVAMSAVSQQVTTVTGTRWEFWELDDPDTGANDVVITFGVAQYNPVSSLTVSTTGSSGAGNTVFDDTAGPPNPGSITVSANSVIMAGLISGVPSGHSITLDGSSRPLEFTHGINNHTSTALSLTGLSAGSIVTEVTTGIGTTAGFYLEIQEGGGGGGARRRVLIV